MRASVWLPYGWQLGLAKGMGGLMFRIARNRRSYARANLAACFPQRSETEIDALLRAHFAALGASLAEMALGWFASPGKLASLTRIVGEQHLNEALQRGKGVILYTAHFTTLEVCGPTLKQLCPDLCAMYRPHRNLLLDDVFRRGRLRSASEVIAKDNVRAMIRCLKRNGVVWYAPDQSYRGKQSELVEFFGEPAMTNVATSQLARLTGAAVVPYFPRRLPGNAGYELVFGPRLEDFPGEDPIADATRLNRLLEDHIQSCPEQYYWVHRKFKGRPPPYPDIYARGA
jgi:KDO2-lipid IV(A) lauroyltransferase